ncbi:MAG: universal stress protein [Terriglobales bacterium]
MNQRRRDGSFRKILVGYDGSDAAEKAVELALSLAVNMDSMVVVLAVAQPPEPPAAMETQAVVDGAREYYEKTLRKIADAAKENGIQVTTAIAVGHAAEKIVRRAEQTHADLIVVGRRGRSTFEKVIMGSVSERVLRYAPCPVLVTK